jgi:hypothetical protein
MKLGIIVKNFALFCMLFVPMKLAAQKQYFLPTGDSSMDEKERPLIDACHCAQECASIVDYDASGPS